MTFGSALAGCTLIGLSQVSTLWQFYLYWSWGLGIAMAFILYPVSFTVITSLFVRERGRAFAILTLLGGLASPIFIPLTGWLIPLVGWRTVLLWCGILHLVIAVPLHVRFIRRAPDQHGPASEALGTPPAPSQDDSSTAHQALMSLRFWVLTGAYALALLGSVVVLAHQIAYLVSRGYGSLLAATVAGALGLTSLLGRFGLNLLSRRVSAQTALVGTLFLQAIGILVLILARDAWWLLLYVLLYGAAYGALSPLRAQVMADHFGKRAYGTITGIQGVPLAFCQAAGPLVAGGLYDKLHRYDLAFWLCAGIFVVAALLTLGVPQKGSETS